MSLESHFVVSVGASTSVGRDAWSSAAAVRAGITGFVQHPHLVDSIGEPIRLAMAPWLDVEMPAISRFTELLWPAIDQALVPLDAAAEGARLALALALPAGRPGVPGDLEQVLRTQLARRYEGRFAAIALFPHGHAAGLIALDAACAKLAQGAFDACVVAGVDSWVNADALDWLDGCEQIHGAGPLNNAWGFIPGEGAGALLIVGEAFVSRLGSAPLVRVLTTGRGLEANRIKTETICIGEGLTSALREAIGGVPSSSTISDVYCDMNGEPYRADEFGFAGVRVKERFQSLSDFVAPADCWGDVSAASGPLFVALAAIAGLKGYAKGRFALAWASSEEGERSAVSLELPSRG
jgi:3-oxoacyl-[acyl-carrier-protein] synthase-1